MKCGTTLCLAFLGLALVLQLANATPIQKDKQARRQQRQLRKQSRPWYGPVETDASCDATSENDVQTGSIEGLCNENGETVCVCQGLPEKRLRRREKNGESGAQEFKVKCFQCIFKTKLKPVPVGRDEEAKAKKKAKRQRRKGKNGRKMKKKQQKKAERRQRMKQLRKMRKEEEAKLATPEDETTVAPSADTQTSSFEDEV